MDVFKNEKSVYTLIEDYSKKANWSKEEKNNFYQRLAHYLLYEKNALTAQLKTTNLLSGQRSDERARKRLGFIRSAVLCGMPIEAFGVEETDVFPLGKGIFTKHMYFAFNFEDEDFEQKYVDFMYRFLEDASQELQVYDYLGRGDKDIPTRGLAGYFRAYRDIFNCIEERLQKGMKYTRILGLRIKENNRDNFGDVSLLILRQCSPELFHHMCVCLNEYDSDRVQFYATNRSSRTYQFAIIKEENRVFIYEERYHLDEKGDAYPSFATTHISEERREMHFIYDKEISNHVTNTDDILFTKETFTECFRQIIDQYRENGFADVEPRARSGFRDITNRKIKAFNKVFGKEKDAKEWSDLALFE